jgi:outer membrane protein insertion porin family
MIRWTTALAVFLSCVMISAASGSAPRISAIEINAPEVKSFDESFVLTHVSLKKGGALDRSLLSRDVKRLLETGRFSNVTVTAEPAEDDSVKLVFTVYPKPRLAEPVRVVGAEYYDADAVEGYADLRTGSLVSDKEAGQAAVRVEEQYRKKYFADVKVTPEIQPVGDGAVRVILNVNEGRQAHVAEVKADGCNILSESEIRNYFKRPMWWNPLTWFRGRKYDGNVMHDGRFAMQQAYLDRGFLDMQAGEPVMTTNDHGNLVVTVSVNEGVQFRYGRILLEGVTLFSESAIRKVMLAKQGEIAGRSTTDNTAQAIRDYFGSRGYIETMVRVIKVPDVQARTVDVTFVVSEGKLASIRNIRITGNIRTKDKVIRRELKVVPGDIFDEVRVRNSERILMNLGYFSAVRNYPLDTTFREEKDLVFEVEEKSTGRVMFGAGFSSIDEATMMLELTQANFDLFNPPYFTGGGQKLQLTGELGTKRDNISLSFTEPWFMDHKLLFGFGLYHRSIDYDEYDEFRTGGDLRFGKSFWDDNRAEIKYSLEDLEIKDFGDTNVYNTSSGEEFIYPAEQAYVQSTLSATVLRDRRDRSFVSTRGYKARLSAGISGGLLGFDADMYTLGATFWKYYSPWRGHVISLVTTYETLDSYGDNDEIPFAERLYIGGGRTLRGFEYRDVGPKVTRTSEVDGNEVTYYKAVGGQSMAMLKAEYWIPLVDKIRFAVFYDIGNVWEDPFTLETSGLASSFGAGLRFDMPGFPIRIDYAKVIEKDDELTQTEPWVFWIGYDM